MDAESLKDTRFIRVIKISVVAAIALILCLLSAGFIAEQYRVESSGYFNQLVENTSDIGTMSQRVALLQFGSLTKRESDLAARLIIETDTELQRFDEAEKMLRMLVEVAPKNLLRAETLRELNNLLLLSREFYESASEFQNHLKKNDSQREIISRSAEQAALLVGSTRTAIDKVSSDAYLRSISDEQLVRAFYIFSFVMVLLTGIAVIVFVASRLNRELKLRRATESNLKKANAELERFSSVVAHDLKAPLTNIALTAELISSNPSRRGPELSGIISQETARLRDMIQALLRLSHVQTSEVSPRNVDVTSLLEDLRISLAQNIERKQAVIEHSGLSMVYADSTLLRNLFQNLIENSLKYDRENHPPHISVNINEGSDYFQITYDDNGRGISEGMRKRVFEPFVQAKEDENTEGVGLGLSVVKRIVTAHGGSIEIVGKESPGTRFVIQLPNSSHTATQNTETAEQGEAKAATGLLSMFNLLGNAAPAKGSAS